MKLPFFFLLCTSLIILTLCPFVLFAVFMAVGFTYGGLILLMLFYGIMTGMGLGTVLYFKYTRAKAPLDVHIGTKITDETELKRIMEYYKRKLLNRTQG